MTEIIYRQESYAIIGACFEVYNEKGYGFLEPVYHECLVIEFAHQHMPAVSKPLLTLHYRVHVLSQGYYREFICFGKIVVELKVASALIDEHRAQLLNYLHATGFELGLLVNFGHYPRLEHERIARTEQKKNNDDVSL